MDGPETSLDTGSGDDGGDDGSDDDGDGENGGGAVIGGGVETASEPGPAPVPGILFRGISNALRALACKPSEHIKV